MINPAGSPPPRRILVRANRETLALVLAASAATFALAHAIHARPPEAPVADSVAAQAARQDWAGHLADISTDPTPTASVEPMTSASLVVPKSVLALPAPMVRRPRACDTAPCSAKVPASGSAMRDQPSHVEIAKRESHRDRGLLSELNPLSHLPSMSTLGRPFAVAGNTIVGWIGRF